MWLVCPNGAATTFTNTHPYAVNNHKQLPVHPAAMSWGHKEMNIVDSYVQLHLFETAEQSAAVLTKEFNGRFSYDEILRQVVYWRQYYLSP